MIATQAATAVDAFTAEVVRNAVAAITREMKTNLMRTAYSSIIYEAESFMDDAGVVLGKHIPVRVRVEVQGDEITFDLSGVGAQVAGYFNSGPTAGRSACEVAFNCLTRPLLLPINEGSFRPLTIVLPPGRVVRATNPAAMRWWMTIPQTVVDTIFKALVPACPERVIAGHHADLASGGAYGFIDPETGRVLPGAYGGAGLAWPGWREAAGGRSWAKTV